MSKQKEGGNKMEIEIICNECGSTLSAGLIVCNECGSKLSAGLIVMKRDHAYFTLMWVKPCEICMKEASDWGMKEQIRKGE